MEEKGLANNKGEIVGKETIPITTINGYCRQ